MPKRYLRYSSDISQAPFLWGAEIAVRGASPAARLVPVLQQRISEIDRSHPVYEAKTLEQALNESVAPRRFNLFLLASFAVSALVLALIGIYGVISYFVAERTREIGVRMALGAQRGKVAVMVVREVLPATISGIIIGLGAAWALMRLMTTLLYDVNATDPQIFAAVAIVLGITALGACVAPAFKAALLDPIVALRYE
jgi:putative ABC transport system permease protein